MPVAQSATFGLKQYDTVTMMMPVVMSCLYRGGVFRSQAGAGSAVRSRRH